MKPKTLFKYQDTSINSISNLKKQVLFMASPKQFNDPYDCAICYKLYDYDDNEIENIKNKFIELEDAIEVKNMLKTQNIESFRDALRIGAKKTLKTVQENFHKSNGVCCFSEINNELLMWAHYSDKSKGFCLEFRTEYEPFSKLHKVRYVANFSKIDLVNLIINDDYNIISTLYCTKSNKWEYEKEWRILHTNLGTEYHYQPECLKAIYFGAKMIEIEKQTLGLIIKERNPKVELWNSELSEDDFSINFNRIG